MAQPANVNIPQDLRTRALAWIENDVCESSKQELLQLIAHGNSAELADRMAGPLEFGTAGLRGVLGAGSNRMNLAVVVRSAAGIAEYLIRTDPYVTSRGVVIGYDARRMGRTFAETAAGVLAAYEIPVHLYPDFCPTPLVPYAITKLQAVAGIMVTASHNPPEYNGMKVYWGNGAQIIAPHDKGMAAAIESVPGAALCKRVNMLDARKQGKIVYVEDALTESYLNDVLALARNKVGTDKIRIVYTPLHGVGKQLCVEALSRLGVSDLHLVNEQAEPNGEFPTVRSPNPEDIEALNYAVALATKVDADIIVANDPDADRLAVSANDRRTGSFLHLTGNQIGVLFAQYLLEQPPYSTAKSLYMASIVSSPMLKKMAEKRGVMFEEVLTGFKWIGTKAIELEHTRGAKFVFGYEEAIGYSVGPLVRDKDGISAAVILAELAAFYKSQGLTIAEKLEQMYREYGLYVSSQHNITRAGLAGTKEISQIMSSLREQPPTSVAGIGVVAVSDYESGRRIFPDASVRAIDLPPSNVLAYELADGSRIMARPSGTEPKIKFYFDVCEPIAGQELFATAHDRATEKLNRIRRAFLESYKLL